MKITKTIEYYGRTASGKSWQKNPYKRTVEEIDKRCYDNYVAPEAMRFFGSRAEYNYTCAGYLPTRVTSVNPDRTMKVVAKFKFE